MAPSPDSSGPRVETAGNRAYGSPTRAGELRHRGWGEAHGGRDDPTGHRTFFGKKKFPKKARGVSTNSAAGDAGGVAIGGALITEKGDLGLAQTLLVSSRPPWVPCDLWKKFDGPNGVVIDARSARLGFQSKVRAKF